MTTQDFVLNDYQGRLVSWHLGLWERQDYLYPLPAVWLTKGLEKPRISLEEDVPIIKRQNNGQVYKLKPGGGGVSWNKMFYNQFIATPAQAKQNCNIVTLRAELLQDLSAPVKIQVKQYTTNKQFNITLSQQSLLASIQMLLCRGYNRKDVQELQMYNKHSLGELFSL